MELITQQYAGQESYQVVAEWLEINYRAEQTYRAELESQLIEAQIEMWLAREALQCAGIDTQQPLREAILELQMRLK